MATRALTNQPLFLLPVQGKYAQGEDAIRPNPVEARKARQQEMRAAGLKGRAADEDEEDEEAVAELEAAAAGAADAPDGASTEATSAAREFPELGTITFAKLKASVWFGFSKWVFKKYFSAEEQAMPANERGGTLLPAPQAMPLAALNLGPGKWLTPSGLGPPVLPLREVFTKVSMAP